MPQIFVMLSLYAQQQLADKKEIGLFLEELDEKAAACIVHLWKVPEEDVVMSATNLLYADKEADVQIEIRYTAGEDEYDLGQPFDPCPNEQRALANAILAAMKKREFGHGLTLSVWCKPYRRSVFEMGPKRGVGMGGRMSRFRKVESGSLFVFATLCAVTSLVLSFIPIIGPFVLGKIFVWGNVGTEFPFPVMLAMVVGMMSGDFLVPWWLISFEYAFAQIVVLGLSCIYHLLEMCYDRWVARRQGRRSAA